MSRADREAQLTRIARCFQDRADACVSVEGRFDEQVFPFDLLAAYGGAAGAQRAKAQTRAFAAIQALEKLDLPIWKVRQTDPRSTPSFRGVEIAAEVPCRGMASPLPTPDVGESPGFRGATSGLKKILGDLEQSDTVISAKLRELRTSSKIVITFHEYADPDRVPLILRAAGGGLTRTFPQFEPVTGRALPPTEESPQSTTIFLCPSLASQTIRDIFGLEMTPEQLVAHELGHAWTHLKINETGRPVPDESMLWENSLRPPGRKRPRH